ncbi:MAG: hypothetical protein LBO00_09365 [Zoogloeaceae bacterium]|jgi:hypothetical protein|nr:hypothetical protein [Zoogloeaceae bacterium]
MSWSNILRDLVLAAIFPVVFLTVLSVGYLLLAIHLMNAANEKARLACDEAIIGEEMRAFQKRMGQEGIFREEKNEYIFLFYSHMTFSAASCHLGVQQNRIVSKRVEEAKVE